jgi:LysR family hydrogen peroxide-inducible transcriptional activator
MDPFPMDAPKLTLKQLRYLCALADMGHFRQAAEACGISQPSLSIQLQNLEDTLSTLLVERGRGGVVFTPIGREVVARARRILTDSQAIVDFATEAQKGLAGTIRLGVKATLGPYLLPKIVSALHTIHPGVKLYIRESLPNRLEAELVDGTHDLILAQLPVNNSDLFTQRLFREPILLAMSREHPLASHTSVTLADLKGLSVLSLSPDFHLHDQIHALCDDHGAHMIRDYEGTSLDALRQMVAMDMGVTFLPHLYTKSEVVADGDVVALPIKGRSITRSVGLVWRKGAGRASSNEKVAQVFHDTIRADFDGLILDA